MTGFKPDSGILMGGSGMLDRKDLFDSDKTIGSSSFPPVADYGFLSDCETTALVAPSGNVEWMCIPRMDSPSVFGSILDRDAGTFRMGPADIQVPASRRYLPGTTPTTTPTMCSCASCAA